MPTSPAAAQSLHPGSAGSAASAGGPTVRVIVQAAPGQLASAEAAVRALDGTVDQELGIINGFAATVHEGDIAGFSALPSVRNVSADGKATIQGSAYH